MAEVADLKQPIFKGALNEVTLPETSEEEELGLYRRYREIGGSAIEEYERQLENGSPDGRSAQRITRG